MLALLVARGWSSACRDRRNPDPDPPARGRPTIPGELFSEGSAATGLDFVHFNGMSGEYYLPEITGPGGALADFDNDGDLDLYLVQGRMLGPRPIAAALFPPAHGPPLTDRLYRNDLATASDGTRRLRFTDVTAASGLEEATGYGMGAAAGDFDNDGRVDLYVTSLGANRLLRNQGPSGAGGGVAFRDVTGASGTGEERWSVSAAFLDFDRDGRLDLYVANYVDFRLLTHRSCYSDNGALDYCGPLAFEAEHDRLFRNRGDGTFEDVSASSGIRHEHGGALGVVPADFDGDGWLDLYVANDQMPNQLWINRQATEGRIRFENRALLAGCSLNGEGVAEASMGVDAGDVDGDGDEDLFLAHLARQTSTLYTNDGGGLFEDSTTASGLGMPSWRFTGFGTAFFDYDNDGRLDLFVANGAVKTIEALAAAGDPYPLHQPNQIFRNLGNDADGVPRFEEVSGRAAAAFGLSEVSRGAVFGDLDNDGDTDILVINNNGPARVLINEVGQLQPWLGLRLLGAEVERDMLGARVTVERPGRRPLVRRARTAGSFASAHDPRVLVGLGGSGPLAGPRSAPRVERVEVEWPSGRVEEWTDLPLGRYTSLREGTGGPG